MTAQNTSPHPMLEPLDYDLDPHQAEAYYSGNELLIYTLLWRAGIATVVEGPVIREHHVALTFKDSKVAPFYLVAHWTQTLSSGWGALLPKELLQLRHCYIDEDSDGSLSALVPTHDSSTMRAGDCRATIDHAIRLKTREHWTVQVVELPQQPFGYPELVEHMESGGVGRPSTYASRIEASIKNGLISEHSAPTGTLQLQVGANGKNIAACMAVVPPSEFLGADLCGVLERALEEIEQNPDRAGSLLGEFCQQLFGKTPALADWLDDIDIEGENLSAALDRQKGQLPAANGWKGVVIPLGIQPMQLVRNSTDAMDAREVIDALLAEPDRDAWRNMSARARATARLAAVAMNSEDTGRTNWLTQANRDVVLRWWIDLSPEAMPISEHELETACISHASTDLADSEPLRVGIQKAINAL